MNVAGVNHAAGWCSSHVPGIWASVYPDFTAIPSTYPALQSPQQPTPF